MSIVLAAIDDSAAAAPVLDAARAIGGALHASVQAFHVDEEGQATATGLADRAGVPVRVVRGDPLAEILEAASDPAVSIVVVGARDQIAGPRPVGHIARAAIERTGKAVLVVPPDAPTDSAPALRRVLVPLEGAQDTAEAVAAPLRRLSQAGVEILALHVFDAEHVPRFWDQPAHAEQGFASEFRARWCEEPTTPLRLRTGSPPGTVLDVAAAEDVDLIALAWSQDLSAGRGAVVRAALTDAHVPVLLLPTDPRDDGT